MPKISVIVPVYKVEPYIHRCIDSILNQTFTDFELILVDDGSPDNCGIICDEYAKEDNRIYVIHQENGGLSAARNAGIDWAFKNSDSEWIAFVDSDDSIHKQYLEILYGFAIKENLEIVCCDNDENFFSEDINIYHIKSRIDSPESLFINFLLNITTACNSIYRKVLFETKRFPINMLHEDEYIVPEIKYSCKRIGFINEKLYHYYINANSISHSKKTPKWINDQFEGLLKQLIFFGNNKFVDTFNIRFRRVKALFSEYIVEYGKNANYKYVFKSNYQKAKKIEKNFKSIMLLYIPQLKKYGFKKWLTGQADDLDNLKNDIKTVASERGKTFAILWGIKSRIKIFNKYRNMPI